MSGNITFQNISQTILDTLDRMHHICLGFALLLIFLSIYRNFQQFGEFLGLKYLAGVLLAVILAAVFPAMADRLFKGMLSWGTDAGRRVEEAVRVMLNVEVDGSWYEAVVIGTANLVYRGGIWIGKSLRDLMILVICGLFLILKTVSPIFIAMLTVPETKSVGINFLTITFGFVMAPLCMIFGDLAMVWTVCQLWEHTGMAAAAAGAVGASGSASAGLALLASSPPGVIMVAAGAVGALVAFACVFVLLCVVMYAGIPWACIALFRGGGLGNALAMSLNTASNVMALSRAGLKTSRGLGGNISDMLRRGSGKDGSSGNSAGGGPK